MPAVWCTATHARVHCFLDVHDYGLPEVWSLDEQGRPLPAVW